MPQVVSHYEWRFITSSEPVPRGAIVFTHQLAIDLAHREFSECERLSRLRLVDMALHDGYGLRDLMNPPLMAEPRRAFSPSSLTEKLLKRQQALATRVRDYGPTVERTVLVCIAHYV